MKRLFGSLAAVALALAPNLSAAVCANSTSCTFTLDLSNGGASGVPGNFGTVSLTTSGADILVSVQLAAGLHLISTGGREAFAFNQTTGGGPVTQSNWSNGQYSQGSPAPFDMAFFGSFEDGVATTAGPGAGTTGVNFLSFKVLGHTNVNDLAELSTHPPGSTDAFFAADVFADNPTACGAGGFAAGSCTGLVGATGGGIISNVPEPSSYLALLLAGFGAVVLLVERRRRDRVTAK
jgi:hypothetical protein